MNVENIPNSACILSGIGKVEICIRGTKLHVVQYWCLFSYALSGWEKMRYLRCVL